MWLAHVGSVSAIKTVSESESVCPVWLSGPVRAQSATYTSSSRAGSVYCSPTITNGHQHSPRHQCHQPSPVTSSGEVLANHRRHIRSMMIVQPVIRNQKSYSRVFVDRRSPEREFRDKRGSVLPMCPHRQSLKPNLHNVAIWNELPCRY